MGRRLGLSEFLRTYSPPKVRSRESSSIKRYEPLVSDYLKSLGYSREHIRHLLSVAREAYSITGSERVAALSWFQDQELIPESGVGLSAFIAEKSGETPKLLKFLDNLNGARLSGLRKLDRRNGDAPIYARLTQYDELITGFGMEDIIRTKTFCDMAQKEFSGNPKKLEMAFRRAKLDLDVFRRYGAAIAFIYLSVAEIAGDLDTVCQLNKTLALSINPKWYYSVRETLDRQCLSIDDEKRRIELIVQKPSGIFEEIRKLAWDGRIIISRKDDETTVVKAMTEKRGLVFSDGKFSRTRFDSAIKDRLRGRLICKGESEAMSALKRLSEAMKNEAGYEVVKKPQTVQESNSREAGDGINIFFMTMKSPPLADGTSILFEWQVILAKDQKRLELGENNHARLAALRFRETFDIPKEVDPVLAPKKLRAIRARATLLQTPDDSQTKEGEVESIPVVIMDQDGGRHHVVPVYMEGIVADAFLSLTSLRSDLAVDAGGVEIKLTTPLSEVVRDGLVLTLHRKPESRRSEVSYSLLEDILLSSHSLEAQIQAAIWIHELEFQNDVGQEKRLRPPQTR